MNRISWTTALDEDEDPNDDEARGVDPDLRWEREKGED